MKTGQFLIQYHKKIIGIIAIAIFIYFNPFFIIKRSEKKIFKETFSATVEDKYFTIKDRRRKFIVLKELESDRTFNYFTLNNNAEIFEIVELSDTIIKKVNSFEISIRNCGKILTINTERKDNSFFWLIRKPKDRENNN